MTRALLGIGLMCSALVACGSEDPPPATMTNACGTVQALTAMDCTGLATCGAGAQNHKKVTPCDHCLAGVDSHVCEAGACRAIPTTIDGYGTIRAAFSQRQIGTTAQGLAQAAIFPVMADGTRITCAALMADCAFVNNPAINALSNSVNVMAAAGDVLFSLATMEPGSDRLYFAQFTTGQRGTGTVVARGCVEGLTIVAGETKEVVVDLSAP